MIFPMMAILGPLQCPLRVPVRCLFRPMFDLDLGPPNSRGREILEVTGNSALQLVDFPRWITGDPPCFIMFRGEYFSGS